MIDISKGKVVLPVCKWEKLLKANLCKWTKSLPRALIHFPFTSSVCRINCIKFSFHFVFIYLTHLTFDLYFIVSSSADLAANINLSVLVLMLLCNPNVTGATLSSTLINPRPPLSLSVGSYSLHYSLDRGHYA